MIAILLNGSLVIEEDVELPAPIGGDWHLDRATTEEENGWRISHPGYRPDMTAVFGRDVLPIEEGNRPTGFLGSVRYSGMHPQPDVSRWVVLRNSNVAKGRWEALERALRLVSPDLAVAARVQNETRPEIMGQFGRMLAVAGSERASAWMTEMNESGQSLFPWYTWTTQVPWYPTGTTTMITNDWIQDLRETAELLADLDRDRFPHLARALEIYFDTDLLSPNHALFTMGRFASLESLLVHSPARGDLVDSISNQVVRSVLLLSNRMQQPIDFETFVDKTDPSKAIKRAYGSRSLIAHGGARLEPFEAFTNKSHKDLALFGTALGASMFCHEMTRSVIHHALREPQLVHDLKG